jgi:hypothetical protein
MTSTTRWRRIAAAALVPAALCVGMQPAGAHGGSGQAIPDAAHYLAQITAISPATPGLTASINPRGDWIEVANTTTKTLTILGYAKEPYLQIGPGGVSENSYSPTLQLNQSLFGDLSQLGGPQLPPDWRQVGTSHQTRWHDHRIHWMAATRPPAVAANPYVGRLIGRWTVHMLLDTTPVNLTGTLSWLALSHHPVLSVTWMVVDTGALLALIAAVIVLARRRRRPTTTDTDQTPTPANYAGLTAQTSERAISDLMAERRQAARDDQDAMGAREPADNVTLASKSGSDG